MEQERQYHHGNLADDILARAAEIIAEEGIEALTLRGIARDLGVSHGAPNRHFRNKAALLSALAREGWKEVREATLGAAEETGSDDPYVRLNAMGRGFLGWSLAHPALFRALTHPDVARFGEDDLNKATEDFQQTIKDAVAATQAAGRHPDVPLDILSLYTNAVPFGAAMAMINPVAATTADNLKGHDLEIMIAKLIELVVPIAGRR